MPPWVPLKRRYWITQPWAPVSVTPLLLVESAYLSGLTLLRTAEGKWVCVTTPTLGPV